MIGTWRAWVERCARPVDVRPLAAVRIAVALCLLADLVGVARLGLVQWLWVPYAHGGMSVEAGADWVMGALGPQAGPLLAAVAAVCLVGVLLGVGSRPASLVAVLALAQLGHLYAAGDRAIDRLLRTVLLVLLFTNAHRRWALWPGRHGPAATTAGWAEDILLWLLVFVYLAAGVGKVLSSPSWFVPSPAPPLLRVLADPLAAWLPAELLLPWATPLWLAGMGAVLLECTAFLLLTRWRPWWALGGLLLHIGIAATMKLGMFSYGMLSLYPLLLAPWWMRGMRPATSRS